MPQRIPLYAAGFPPGIRLADVIRHYARMGWRVHQHGLRLVATREH